MNRKILYLIIFLTLVLITSCSKQTYIVGFDTSGGTIIDDQIVEKKGNVMKPNNPEKEGHKFIGWFVGDEEFDFNTKIENHMIILAKWEKNEYNVTYITNTEQIISDSKVKYNECIKEPTLEEKENYTFLGWYLNDELYDFNNPVKNDITLVAKWEKSVFEVKFNTECDINIDNQYISINQKVTNPSVKREGYKFLGWYLNDELYDFNNPVKNDITLVAKWEIIKHIITFNTNTEEKIDARFVEYGTLTEEPILSLEGYDFLGWFYKGELYDFTKPVKENASLTARWEMTYEKIEELLNNVVPEKTTENLNFFPYLDKCSAEFIWESSNEDVISLSGKVTRLSTDRKITIKVIVLYSDNQYEFEYKTTVLGVKFKELIKGEIVSGYLADYGSFRGLSDKMLEQLDIINYSFAQISNGELVIPSYLKKDLVLSYRDKGVRVVLAVGGWGADGFSQAVRTKETRTKFIKSIMNVLKQYQFDGIDIDWEYPGSGVAGIEYHSSDKNNLNLFCQELRTEMDIYREDLILSIAVAPSPSLFDFATLNKYVDFFNLMTYDFAMGSTALHDSNLYAYTQSSSSMANSVATLKKYVDSDKIIPGAAFYTRRGYFKNENDQRIGASLSTPMSTTPLTYAQLIKMLKDDPTIVESYDEVAQAAYIIHKRWFYSYDNPRSILAKCNFIKENNLGGIMCWDLTNDYTDENGYGVLVKSMYEGMK